MKVGEKIPLDLVLWDGAENKYVKAIIRSGSHEISGSPVAVPHNSFGHYYFSRSSLVVPDGSKFISIEFIVYNDVAMTIESGAHERAMDIYEIDQDPSSSGVSEKLDQIIEIVTSHGLNNRIVGYVSTDHIHGVVVDEELEGKISKDFVLTGYISTKEVSGKVKSSKITAEVK